MKAFSFSLLLALVAHAHAHREDRAMSAQGWEDVCSRYDTPSVEHLRHYPYGSRHTPYYRSSSSRVPTDSLAKFID